MLYQPISLWVIGCCPNFLDVKQYMHLFHQGRHEIAPGSEATAMLSTEAPQVARELVKLFSQIGIPDEGSVWHSHKLSK